MHIEILGAESLGVRSLCCLVEAAGGRIVLDPGVALDEGRDGLVPHPRQVEVCGQVRRRIVEAMAGASDVVLSHYHGDHMPLASPGPHQLGAAQVPALRQARLWCKGPQGLSNLSRRRRESLSQFLGRELPDCEGLTLGIFKFSSSVSHGSSGLGTVMMTRIQDAGEVMVHASDIQLLDRPAVRQIIDWQPDLVVSSGPPLHLQRISSRESELAWNNALCLARSAATVILDHHLLRSQEGEAWLDRLSEKTDGRIMCASDFMGRPRLLLEAWRERLYMSPSMDL
ncbi:MAG: hypothetical protein GKC10_08165 [Methanosarcinales archaeon]|nr:hypothetical protein [Methanosarcinales archaeon]